jgi:hypothetical protein
MSARRRFVVFGAIVEGRDRWVRALDAVTPPLMNTPSESPLVTRQLTLWLLPTES